MMHIHLPYPRKFFAYGLKSFVVSITLAVLLYHMRDDLKKTVDDSFISCPWFLLRQAYVRHSFEKVRNGCYTFTVRPAELYPLTYRWRGLMGFSDRYREVAMYSHEAIRQPALYIVLWVTLQPFGGSWFRKGIVALILVTGVWLLGVQTGKMCGQFIDQWEYVMDFLGCSIFLFVGDIGHHLFDEFRKLKERHTTLIRE